MSTQLPQTGFIRLVNVIGDPAKGIPGVFPLSRTAWYSGVRSGRYPAPVKIGARASAYRVEDIRELLERFGGRK